MPEAVQWARYIDTVARRYHCLPSQVLREGTDLMRHLAVLDAADAPVTPLVKPENEVEELGLADVTRSL